MEALKEGSKATAQFNLDFDAHDTMEAKALSLKKEPSFVLGNRRRISSI